MRFLLKKISILPLLVLAVTFVCLGNGNRLTTVTDEVEDEAVYNRKEYHDLNAAGTDFGYDANGNLLITTSDYVPRTSTYKLLTPEGYVDYKGNYYYYRRDHLGNVREVWKATDAGAQTVQRTRYYPSGLPWEYQAGDSASLQPHKYGVEKWKITSSSKRPPKTNAPQKAVETISAHRALCSQFCAKQKID